jgi:cation diffusion facilitator family transporter
MMLDRENKIRLAAGIISLVAGTVIMAGKFVAYRLTGSSAIMSDALESIINVVAAAFAVGSILFAGRPADRNHPYGHGRIEFFSAAFEGGLISFAAAAIAVSAVASLVRGIELRQIGTGVLVTSIAGGLNAILGLFLIRIGRRTRSLILIADGKHVLSDFWTTVGVVAALVLVRVTHIPQIDPIVALLVAVSLARTGYHLVRDAARALLDEEDTGLLQKILDSGERVRSTGIIRMHHLRAIRIGRYAHVDAHIVVPQFWSVEQAHDAQDAFEKRLLAVHAIEGEIAFHTDPCKQLYCEFCEIDGCPIRLRPFMGRPSMTLDEATQPDPPPGETLILPKLRG